MPPITENLDEIARHLQEDALSTPPGHPDETTDERLTRLEHELGARDERRLDATAALLIGMLAIAGALIAGVVLWAGRDDDGGSVAATTAAAAAPATIDHAGHAPAAGGDVAFEPYERPDPALPAVPAGDVKRFEMQVFEHVTQVAGDLPATTVWSYAINGKAYRGTGVSTPMVVEQGDKVEIELINKTDQGFKVDFPHSIDFHSAEVAPNEDYSTIGPGRTKTFRFTAEHPGVFMYHCATEPVLMHTGAGMVGAMIVKPRDLPPVDRELWITQQEYYLGATPGAPADMGKMQAEQPDVVAFNGFADQYVKQPIDVEVGESVRMYVMNAGPSLWSAFHVIGTVFDRTVIEGQRGAHAQTVNLAPSQGGWVEFTLEVPGTYPFVNHSFAAAGKGAMGALRAVER